MNRIIADLTNGTRFIRRTQIIDNPPPTPDTLIVIDEADNTLQPHRFDGPTTPCQMGRITLSTVYDFLTDQSELVFVDRDLEGYELPSTLSEGWKQVTRTETGFIFNGSVEWIFPTHHDQLVVIGTLANTYVFSVVESPMSVVEIETLPLLNGQAASYVFFNDSLSSGAAFYLDDPNLQWVIAGVVNRVLTATAVVPSGATFVAAVGGRVFFAEGGTVYIVNPLTQEVLTATYDAGDGLTWDYTVVPDGDGVAVFAWWVSQIQKTDALYGAYMHTESMLRRVHIAVDGTVGGVSVVANYDGGIPPASASQDVSFSATPLHCVDGYAASYIERERQGQIIS